MSTTRWRQAAMGVALATTWVTACAGRGESPDRIAALERRLAELESRLADGGAADTAQAAETNETPRPIAELDASVRVVSDAGPPSTPAERLARCEQSAEFACRMTMTRAKRPAPKSPDGGFVWLSKQEPPPVDATEEGRRCLAKERTQCREAVRREDQLYQWLDAQLAPERVDQAYTTRLRENLDRAGAKAEVLCAPTFCRITSSSGGFVAGYLPDERDGGPGGHQLRTHGGYTYVTRAGYQFPDASTANPWKR